MTTIAYRDGVLAADSQCTFGSSREGRAVKIAQRGPVLAAVCGMAPNARAFLDWFRTGMVGDCPDMGTKDDNAWGFLYTPDDRVIWFKPSGVEDFRCDFHATGSGADYAMGAMAAGSTAEEAVNIAARFDINSSAPVLVLRR